MAGISDKYDLEEMINKLAVSCKNQDNAYPANNLFNDSDIKFLKSYDGDPELLLYIPFNTKVDLHALDFDAPNDGSAPANIRLFINRDDIDTGNVDDYTPVDELELTGKDWEKGSETTLNQSKYHNVYALTIYVEDNGGAESTIINSIKLYGKPIAGVDLKNLKKVG